MSVGTISFVKRNRANSHYTIRTIFDPIDLSRTGLTDLPPIVNRFALRTLTWPNLFGELSLWAAGGVQVEQARQTAAR